MKRSVAVPLHENHSTVRSGAIILAAGESRRMGRAKALLPIEGRPLIAHIAQTCRQVESISRIVVVTGHEPWHIRAALGDFDVRFAQNDDFAAGGMISSVKTGLRACAGDVDAIFVVLGDQPFVTPRTFNLLWKAWCESRALITRPLFDGRHGHPILVAARGADEILKLSGDATLKDFMQRHQREIVDVPVSDRAILLDLDTPADYQHAVATLGVPPRRPRWTQQPAQAAAR